MHEEQGLGDRLKAAREALGYTQTRISEACGSRLRSWQDYEKGNRIPGSQVIAGLSRLNINANWLLTGRGPMWIGAEGGELDWSLMSELLEALEGALQETRKTLTPAKKAEVLRLLYEMELEKEQEDRGHVDRQKVVRFINLAA